MQYDTFHSWDLAPDEAIEQQKQMAGLVRLSDEVGDIRTIAGVDLSIHEETNEGNAIVVLLEYPSLKVIGQHYATGPLRMPYVPGLLSFRESPIALEAFEKVETEPDLIMVDGQGIAHPRGLGIASHLGLLLDTPTIGVAKSKLYGWYDTLALGDTAPVETPLFDRYKKRVIGTVMRTKPRTNPLFISPGHKVSVETAARLVTECLRGYRLPEPTRQAHNLITEYKKQRAAQSA